MNLARDTNIQSLTSHISKETATHSSTRAWRIPWTEEPGGLQSVGLQSDTTEVTEQARPHTMHAPEIPRFSQLHQAVFSSDFSKCEYASLLLEEGSKWEGSKKGAGVLGWLGVKRKKCQFCLIFKC